MTKKTSRLEFLHIPKPCPTDWESLIGDERKRFCTECHKYVYNLSAMTRREAEALIEDSQAKICARFTRLAEGEVLTQEPPILHHINRRPSPIAAAIITAMMSLSPAIAAPQPSQINNQAVSQTENANRKASVDSPGTPAKFYGTVFDEQKAVIAGAKVKLIDESTLAERTSSTTDEGKFQFDSIGAGTYVLHVEAPGFATSVTRGIALTANRSQEIELTLPVMRSESLGGLIAMAVSNPLRELYTRSDRVVVARIGESVVVETAGESKTLMTTLNLSSTLKGADHKTVVYLYHSVYRDEQRLFKPGENVLLFLTQREKQKKQKAGYELFDSSRGVKKLSGDDLQTYTRHIHELANYLKDGKLENEELVEWLVRCTEDQATRWEGATELASNARSLRDRQEEQAPEEASDETEGIDTEERSATEEMAEAPDQTDEDSDLVTKLSDTQKERLVKSLLSVERFDEGDLELLDVVTYFKDSRLVPFLVSHLHRVESAPPRYAENLINTLADFLGDETISEAAENYADEVDYEDLEDEGDASEEVVEEMTVDEANEKKAAIEQRSQLLKGFLTLVEQKLSQPTSLN